MVSVSLRRCLLSSWSGVVMLSLAAPEATAQTDNASEVVTKDAASSSAAAEPPPEAGAAKLVRLSPQAEVWIHKESKTAVVGGEVCNRQGPLEMFACPTGTKEYESVVAAQSKAYLVHAALLAVGAKPGTPVQFYPNYVPARGVTIDVWVTWRDQQGKRHTSRAQKWVRHVKTGKPMPYDWVFAGSGFFKDEETGKEYYQAEGGELICVSNFSTATLDLPIASPQDNDGLFFEAFTENIPPLGTKVKLLLRARSTDAERDRSSAEREISNEQPEH